jgi:hypothetical protein
MEEPSMKLLATLAAATILSGSMAFAALTTDSLIADLTAQGYTRIEARVGPTQIKVEAIKGDTKVETIYDIATGSVLKQETEQVEPGENTSPGVSVRDRGKDFVEVRANGSVGDDDMDDDHRGHGSDDDDDEDDHGGNGGGHGSDDDHDDDHGGNGGGHGSDDDHDDDHGGNGGGHGSDDDHDDDHGSDDDSGRDGDDD